MLASFGSLPVIGCPVAAEIPLPASANEPSDPVCGPYLAIEKLASFARFWPSFATHPRVGTVRIACAPAVLVRPTNVSAHSPATAGPSGRLSKYQSADLLLALVCQL